MEEGTNLLVIQKLGGWSSLEMLRRCYALVSDKIGHDAAAALDSRRQRKSAVDFKQRSG